MTVHLKETRDRRNCCYQSVVTSMALCKWATKTDALLHKKTAKRRHCNVKTKIKNTVNKYNTRKTVKSNKICGGRTATINAPSLCDIRSPWPEAALAENFWGWPWKVSNVECRKKTIAQQLKHNLHCGTCIGGKTGGRLGENCGGARPQPRTARGLGKQVIR